MTTLNLNYTRKNGMYHVLNTPNGVTLPTDAKVIPTRSERPFQVVVDFKVAMVYPKFV
jgi:hypothetical protein